jgi:hypothetical protein
MPVIGEGEPLETSNGLTKLSQARGVIEAAAQTVRQTTLSLADAIEAGRQHDTRSTGSRTGREKLPCMHSPLDFCWAFFFRRRRF